MDATATRVAMADTALNPRVIGTPLVVPVTIRLNSGTLTVSNINQALLPAFGRGFGVAAVGANPVGFEGKPWEWRYWDAARALDLGLPATELVPNIQAKNSVIDAASWTAVGSSTISRSTAEHLFGPASTRFVTTGGGANEGGYLLSGPLPVTGDIAQTFCYWKVGAGGAAVTARAYLAEYDPTNTNLVGKTNGSAVTLSSSWQNLAVGNRTNCTKGNVIRIGVETVGTGADDFHVAGINCSNRSTLFPTPDLTNFDTPGRAFHFLLKFYNQQFDPLLLYDALDQQFATVASDKDVLSQGNYEFLIDV